MLCRPLFFSLLLGLALPAVAGSPVTGWQLTMFGPTETASDANVQYHISVFGLTQDEQLDLQGPLKLKVVLDGRYNGQVVAMLDQAQLSLVGGEGTCTPFTSSADGETATCNVTGGKVSEPRDFLLEGVLRLAYPFTVTAYLVADNGIELHTTKITRLPGNPPPPNLDAIRCDDRGCYDPGTDKLPSPSRQD